jgi:pimeloyl-ACP methyl ester carboxylesterase
MKSTIIDELPVCEYYSSEIMCANEGKSIYGVAYIPKTNDKKFPLVIFSHSLGGSYLSGLDYAKMLASRGIAAYSFDFCGGAINSRSDGETTEMSVMTEVSDLNAVIDSARSWAFACTEKTVLLGVSQGGAVSAIAAARQPDKIAGLILCYPAFLVNDDMKAAFSSKKEIPDSYYLQCLTVSRKYFEDMWDYDVYEEIGNFKKKVLLLHGDKDPIVNILYSKRAAEIYGDQEFYVIEGAGHAFSGTHFDKASAHILNYLLEIGILRKG